jgi:hypothetical protein
MHNEPDNIAELNMHKITINEKFYWTCNSFLPVSSGCLFGEVEFFRLHAESDQDLYMQLVSESSQKVYASLSFYRHERNAFVSPKRGTFGGLMVYASVDIEVLDRFVKLALLHLQTFNPRQILIKLAPFSHDLALSSMMVNFLSRNNFLLAGHELNYDMRVDQQPFFDRISYGNRKRIKKCIHEGYFPECVDSSLMAQVYAVIEENRHRKGNQVSMTLAQLQLMVSTFPGRIQLFAVWQSAGRQRMLASAVCIALSEEIFYVFYWGDVTGMDTMSPITLLAQCIYEYCQKHGFRLLDVGTSTLDGNPNYGLINFKQHLGFTASLKPAFVWKN